MYIVNKKTGTKIYLAKYYPSLGWYVPEAVSIDGINKQFDDSDFGHLSSEERYLKAMQPGFGPPYANGDQFGCDWHIEYEYGPEKDNK
jgi:hypothetical protein